MNNLQTRVCLQCHKPLNGRVDKKFCDAYCRNSYNNQAKGPEEHMIMQVNQMIRRNRRILKNLSPQGKAVIRRDVLDAMGFNFNYFTGVYRSSASSYYMCYDYGYRVMIDNHKQKIQIIQKQEYMGAYDPWKYI